MSVPHFEPLSAIADLPSTITAHVRFSLDEDIGTGDITAELISESQQALGYVITREDCVVAGQAWVSEVFKQVDDTLIVTWLVTDGEFVAANTKLYTVEGNARSILTGERAALNFLQTLSGTATIVHDYVSQVKHTEVKLLDTRKTIPGFRLAQKYAVSCGGGHNHRMGLYDAFLIKENHIISCGSIKAAVHQARANHPDKPVEVETENLDEFRQALEVKAERIMLDDYSMADIATAVAENKANRQHTAELEISGNVNEQTLVPYAETGVDYISIGALTKHCRAIDLSMRFET